MAEKPKVGFIGQGFIGKNYADDFERRGYTVVRYARSEPFNKNRDLIRKCDFVFIAVPTPTTERGFDDSTLREVIGLVGSGCVAIIKSTILPGTTESIQKQHHDKIILHSPEFLAEATASHNASNPDRNIIGVPERSEKYEEAARRVLAILPEGMFNLICSSRESELIKYSGNAFFYFKVLFANIMHDLAEREGADWRVIQSALAADPRIGGSHLRVKHSSGHPGAKAGRGAGGHCLIKDFAALRAVYADRLPHDTRGLGVLKALESKNIELLAESGKDHDLLKGVYGESIRDFFS